ncbi:hypothetical protein VNI00_012692 [Paramarasmius palmivorus]|uniref:Uncharacterized protein n=1 Tax=Paramarasmius palmivorus TaxID=297713 RepID=A0AAW0C497_9AGAR
MERLACSGWAIRRTLSAKEAVDVDCELSVVPRWATDSYSKIFPLGVQSSAKSPIDHMMDLSSWRLFSPDNMGVHMERNVIETPFIPMPVVLIWEAERALWGFMSSQALRTEGNFGRGQGNTAVSSNVEHTTQKYNRLSLSCVTEDDMDPYEFPETDQWLGTSILVGQNSGLQSSMTCEEVTAFLVGFYPRLVEDFKHDVILRRLHCFFREVDVDVRLSTGAFDENPTGFTAHSVLQGLEFVFGEHTSGHVEFKLSFHYSWLTKSVHTVCTFIVPGGREQKLRKALSDWNDSALYSAHVEFAVTTVNGPLPASTPPTFLV